MNDYEDLETGDCLDSEYLDLVDFLTEPPKGTSSQDDAFALLSTALVQFGKNAVPSSTQLGDGGDYILSWQSYYSYCVYVTCWGDGRYEIYVTDRVWGGKNRGQLVVLVEKPRGTLVDVVAVLQDYVAELAAQRVRANIK